jgi:hypothetical protein
MKFNFLIEDDEEFRREVRTMIRGAIAGITREDMLAMAREEARKKIDPTIRTMVKEEVQRFFTSSDWSRRSIVKEVVQKMIADEVQKQVKELVTKEQIEEIARVAINNWLNNLALMGEPHKKESK